MHGRWQLWKRKELREDLGEEIRQHLEQKTEQLMREGKSRAEAEREAKIAFGNPTLIQEQSQEVWNAPFSTVAAIRAGYVPEVHASASPELRAVGVRS